MHAYDAVCSAAYEEKKIYFESFTPGMVESGEKRRMQVIV